MLVEQLQSLAYVLLAMVLGAIVGIEREIADKPAGLRTHTLVCGAAAFFVLLGNDLIADYADGGAIIRSDPVRVIEAVVAGVSFLGAGTIFRRRHESDVAGLTTAASLLFVAAIGVCVALARIPMAVGATALVVGVLYSDHWLKRRRQSDRSRPQNGEQHNE